MTPENPQNELIFDQKILNFEVIYQPLVLKVHAKVDLLRKNLSEKNPTSSFKIGGIFEKKKIIGKKHFF